MNPNNSDSERMEISFRVKEYGDDSCKPCIEIDTSVKRLSFMGDSGTFYLFLKNENNMKKAREVAEYLRNNITGLGFVSFR